MFLSVIYREQLFRDGKNTRFDKKISRFDSNEVGLEYCFLVDKKSVNKSTVPEERKYAK